jgi:type I restriction enzyme S subunit
MQLLEHFKELTIRPKNAKELKGLILQLAIQGKLTANWRGENPTVKLDNEKLTDISVKTLSFLTKESNSINQLDVPSTWLKLKFKTLFEMQGGSQPPKSMFSSTEKDGYIQLYQIRDFGKRPVPVYVPKDSVSKLCSEEDVMIGRYGASIGKIFYGKNGAYNVALVRLIWNRELLEQSFVYQIFSSYYMQDFFQNCTRSAQAGFNKTDMGRLNIPLPPLLEQKEIVKVVETLFKEVEELEQLTVERISLKEDFVTSALNQLTTNNANQEWSFLKDHFKNFFNETRNIKKLRETVLQLAVRGKLTADWRANNPDTEDASILLKRIQKNKAQLIADKKIKKEKLLPKITKDEIPYELPEGWVWCRMIELCQYITDGTHQTPNYTEQGRMFLSAKNVKPFKFMPKKHRFVSEEDFEGYRRNRKPELNDILLTRVGAGIGEATLIDQDLEFAIYVSVGLLKMFPGSLEPNYIVMWLNSPEGRQYSSKNTYGKGVSQGNLNLSLIRKFVVSLPPIEEQKAIVQKVNALMGLCDSLEQEVQESQEQIAQLMQSCLREVFEGQKEVS